MSHEMTSLRINGKGPYGFRIQGGAEFGQRITIKHVIPGSKAEKAGFLVGDILLVINDVDVKIASHDTAKTLISKADELVVTVKRTDSSSSTPGVSLGSPPCTSRTQSEETSPLEFDEAGIDLFKSPVMASRLIHETQPSTHKETSSYGTRSSKSFSPYAKIQRIHPIKSDQDSSLTHQDDIQYTDQPFESSKMQVTNERTRHVCYSCKEVIKNLKYLQYMDKFWHFDHFLCDECQIKMPTTDFYEKDNKLFCLKCFSKHNSQLCESCHKYCIKNYVMVAGKSYHDDCFKCYKCSHPLSGIRFDFHENRLHCSDCISDIMNLNCHACFKRINVDQNYVRLDEKEYHSTCLKCHICNLSLSDKNSVVLKDQRPCCPDH